MCACVGNFICCVWLCYICISCVWLSVVHILLFVCYLIVLCCPLQTNASVFARLSGRCVVVLFYEMALLPFVIFLVYISPSVLTSSLQLSAAQQQFDAERVMWEQTRGSLILQVDKVRV